MTQVTTIHEARDAKTHKHLPTKRMRIKSERVAVLVLGENNIVERGEHDITVFERDVPAILAQVETDKAKMVAAEEMFRLELAEEVGRVLNLQLSPEEILTQLEKGKDERLTAAFKDVVETTASSVAGCFRALAHRDIKPLSAAKVIDEETVNPHRADELGQQKTVADMVAKSMNEAMGGKGKKTDKTEAAS